MCLPKMTFMKTHAVVTEAPEHLKELAQNGCLSLDGLITHHDVATHAAEAYRTAFGDAACLKMILDWRTLQ